MAAIWTCSAALAGLLTSHGALAAACAISGEPVQLDTESVEWTLVIDSGRECVSGLRSSAMTLESVRIVSQAQVGHAFTQGYGLRYRAKPGFVGEDSFAVMMRGAFRGLQGQSILRVRVIVR